MSDVNKISISLSLLFLMIFSVAGGAGALPSDPLDKADESQINISVSSTYAIEVEVLATPDDAREVDLVTITYNVDNSGKERLCGITINNSLTGVTPVGPFDLEGGENVTLTAEYNIASQDRQLPYVIINVSATGYSCKNGRAMTIATASCGVLLS